MGAMALFGEKYGDEVRVIRYDDSVELCGGTHVDNTGNIGMIKIVSESSIAAGVRRIEAITGERVEKAISETTAVLRQVSEMLNNAPDVVAGLRRAIDENTSLRHQAEEYFKERVRMQTAQLLADAETVAGVKVVDMTGMRMADVVKAVAFAVREQSPENTAFIGATVDLQGKPLLTVMFTDDLVKSGYNASTAVREAAKAIKGGGGGQPGFAQAGGKNADGIAAAHEALLQSIKR